MKISFRPILLLIALASSLVACPSDPPKPTITQVTLTVPNVTVVSGSSQNVSAEVTGTGAFDPTVNWTATDGTLQKLTGALNSYTAPTVTVSKTVTITATSKADTSKLANVTITVNPPAPNSSITLVTASAAKTALAASEVTTLSAVVTGTGAFSNGVTWSKTSGNGTLSTTTGSSIDFTAPSATTASTTAVRATSVQDTSKFAEITLSTAAAAVNAPTVSISSPSVDVFTKGAVTFQVVVTGAPDSVELLKDGAVLATLVSPYTYAWDTTTEPEKAYSMTAKAKKAGTADVTSAAKQVTVDRTAPTLVSRVPANGTLNVFLADEISATFSEPILASSVNTTSAQLKIGTNVVSSSATLDTAGTKLVLKPTLLPALTATIAVALNGLTDRAGNALTVPNSSFNAPDWQALGGIQALNSASTLSSPQIAVDSSGKPVVAWSEAGNISVKKWNGTSWDLLPVTLGGVDSMALDSAGNPIVSWNKDVGNSGENKYDTFVKKWDGAAWAQLGTALDVNTNTVSNAVGTNSSVAIDSSDNPTVTWSEYNNVDGVNIYVKRWDGINWKQLGSTSLDVITDQEVSNPNISISLNITIVSWMENDGNSTNIYVKKWNGTTWSPLGGALDNTLSLFTFRPDIAIDLNGDSIVLWIESGNLYAKKWNGSTWISLGAALNTTNNLFNDQLSIVLDSSGNPTASWAEGDGTSANIYVKKWNGSAWVSQGAILDVNPNDNAYSPSLAIDSSNNPFVTWQENANIYVKRFNRIP